MSKINLMLMYFFAAPVMGGIIAGLDRKINARMQSRIGPPLLQPFFDVGKLFQKETLVVRRSQNFYISYFLFLMIFTGAIFFSGGDLLLMIFAFALAGIFFVLAGFKASSPYSFIGAQRELLQMMAYEPAVLLMAIGMYMVTGSFYVRDIVAFQKPILVFLPGVFLSFIYIFEIKVRKSPFDLSTSHHAHQELIKGITTEFSGRALAMIEISHWYENTLLVGMLYLFWATNPVVGILLALGVFFLGIFVDNTFARFKWQKMLFSSWIVALVFGFLNIVILFLMQT